MLCGRPDWNYPFLPPVAGVTSGRPQQRPTGLALSAAWSPIFTSAHACQEKSLVISLDKRAQTWQLFYLIQYALMTAPEVS